MKKLKVLKKFKKPKIVEKKLGRSGCWGFCYWEKPLIEIEKSAKGKKRLKYVVHELLHYVFGPSLPEYKVLKAERIIGDALWDQKYRRIDE